MLATRFLQAGKGVATLPACFASRPATDLAALHVLPDLALAKIVMQWQRWVAQNQQQLFLDGFQASQGLLQFSATGLRMHQAIETLSYHIGLCF